MAVVIKSALVLAPGVVTFVKLLGGHGWGVSGLAALGVEFLVGIAVTFGVAVAAQVKAQRASAEKQ